MSLVSPPPLHLLNYKYGKWRSFKFKIGSMLQIFGFMTVLSLLNKITVERGYSETCDLRPLQ